MKLSLTRIEKAVSFLLVVVVVTILLTSCVGSSEPRNPMKRTRATVAPVKSAEPAVVDSRDTTQTNPYLTDEEKAILKRADDELKKLEEKEETFLERRVY